MPESTTATGTPVCKPLTSLLLPCPCCGAQDATISINLGALSEDGSDEEFVCGECNTGFGRVLLVAIFQKWPAVIRWVESVPQFESEE